MLTAQGICKRYFRQGKGTNYFMAVQKTDFALPAGQVTALMGRSGSGKSTLLNMLGGLLAPTEGRVYLDETDLYALDDARLSALRGTQIGIVPQGQAAVKSLTVLENTLLPAALQGRDARGEAQRLLESMGMETLNNAWPEELSGGELRRMAIARALAICPAVLLADEPTGDLDDENTAIVLRALREAADGGVAVLMVTHEQDALRIADTVWRMNAGVLTQEN